MEQRVKSILASKYGQETAVFLFVMTIHLLKYDWVHHRSALALAGAFGYFLILYIHAQTNRFLLLPTLLVKRMPFEYIGGTIVLILLFSFGIHEYANYVLAKIPNSSPSYNKGFLYQAAGVTANLVIILGPIIMFKFYREQKRQQDEALLFNELQLQSLRSQLNPHFLFNTFNTLYGTSLQHPERTPDLIMKVSQLLRYQIESDSRQWVTLEEELEFINSYIQLEKERVGYRCNIAFDDKIKASDSYKIPPMLLIVFVENAFKHGTGTVENCFVTISMEIVDSKLVAKISNSIPQKKQQVISTKIGLQKTRERLDLLHGDNYKMEVDQQPECYTVSLELPLKKVASCHPCAVA
ncbi:histidine kinase [Flavobacterium sp. SE-s28]|uniref:Histidine kinase n=2 Tax=Flavobacterium silvaticum TaxID=1852020 RepID=A0A972JG25_9FLAO|nr:histidine kinase [Flavobacterium silvaticum]